LLDARRTPVTVAGVDRALAVFEVVVEAFEDAGARWRLPLDYVARFQFARGGALLDEREAGALQGLVVEAMRALEVPATGAARAHTDRALALEGARVREAIASRAALRELDLAAHVAAREGCEEAITLLASLAAERGVAPLEQELARTYVSNPESGEIVKGHAIVLAEMGLCAYSGRIVVDESLFDGDGAKDRRRAHILLRLAFLRELMAAIGRDEVELYRGAAHEGAVPASRVPSLVAATFSREVATSHFDGGPTTRTALLARQRVPVGRLFMTFLETAAMNDRYREAEAVLIGDPGNLAF
jgi:hypothetical protein